ncbi:hypothetical protein [Streptomyces sp. NPDC045251]|uniref:hypothetical protein n=1 Tax=unclassified Streptomyces TaxID=2593676 RepID=UPI0033D5EB59
MADGTGLDQHLADLAAEGRRFAVPPAAEQIRARGERRRRRKRVAQVSGGALLAVAVVSGGLWLALPGSGTAPPAAHPSPSSSGFVPPAPAPGEEYASEIGYVYDAVLAGDSVRVTVKPRTGAVHTLTLSPQLPVEVEHVAGGEPADMSLGELVDRLSGGPRWQFAVDYDGEGRVRSLREASW